MSQPPDPVDALARTCPNCGATMVEAKCELRCERCGYFQSCSEF